MPTSQTPRRLRADAERNRQLILEAARRAFAEQGLGVRFDEIAEQAGVGVGTVYRRFKDKEALIEALFVEALDEMADLADEALAASGDGTGLRAFLMAAMERMVTDRGLQQLLLGGAAVSAPMTVRARELMAPRVASLAAEAHEHGRLRADVEHTDLLILQLMLTITSDATNAPSPDLWRRYAQLVLDALDPQARDRTLDGSPPTTDEVQAVMTGWRSPPRHPGARG